MFPLEAIQSLKLAGAPLPWVELLMIWEVEQRLGQTHKMAMIELIAEKAVMELARAGIV